MSSLPLLAVPNVSEGRDPAGVEAIATAFVAGGAARLLDVHADVDHHRAVITLAGRAGSLADALVAGAAEAVRRVDIGDGGRGAVEAVQGVDGGDGGGEGATEGERRVDIGDGGEGAAEAVRRVDIGDGVGEGATGTAPRRRGEHPYVGAVDVVPVVYLDPALRGAACAEALVAADRIGGELGVPVFIYGDLARGRTRAQLRRGGVQGLAQRIRSGELSPDFGPLVLHPTAGATLVCARGPLVAFNLELAPSAGVEDARRIASLIREGGAEGLPGVRAIGVILRRGPAVEGVEIGMGVVPVGRVIAQVSINVERPFEVPLRRVVDAVRAHAELARAELVGLAPAAALEDFPEDLPMPGFDPARHVIERVLAHPAGDSVGNRAGISRTDGGLY